MSSSRRLLVTHVTPVIDIRLIRYAAMLARLEERISAQPTESVLSALQRVDARRQTVQARHSLTWSTDSEARFLTLLSRSTAGDPQQVLRSARLALRARVDAHFRRSAANMTTGCDAVRGRTAGRVLTYAADFGADMLLVGRDGWTDHDLAKLALMAPCTTLFVPPDWAPVLRRILVPIDFSRRAIDGLKAAIRLGQRFAPAKCVLLHVDRQDTRCGGNEVAPSRRSDLMSSFDDLLGQIETNGVRMEPVIVKGQHVERAIARAADDHAADLVVMATRGRTRFARGLLRSLTGATLRAYGGAMLAVNPAGPPMSWREAVRDRWREAEDPLFN